MSLPDTTRSSSLRVTRLPKQLPVNRNVRGRRGIRIAVVFPVLQPDHVHLDGVTIFVFDFPGPSLQAPSGRAFHLVVVDRDIDHAGSLPMTSFAFLLIFSEDQVVYTGPGRGATPEGSAGLV